MTDIMMCDADDCDMMRQCYRNKASGTKPNEYMQSYWMRDKNSPKGKDCPILWVRK